MNAAAQFAGQCDGRLVTGHCLGFPPPAGSTLKTFKTDKDAQAAVTRVSGCR
jgi:hypothetical protein